LLPALSAGHANFDSLFYSGGLGSCYGRQSFILCLLAGFAAFRLVSQAFIMKEDLFTDSPNKLLAAIHAGDRSILKVGILTVPGFG